LKRVSRDAQKSVRIKFIARRRRDYTREQNALGFGITGGRG